ncbi:hypothetical protein [Anaerovibrio sp. RM50]|uniref:hypothetical protein n=1 Tax=Anaerovibrio sp. RM50 TaxID=1200557 RepID=UPI0004826BE4|nr:hypothetical protein [Anaerovibrio sp. RM50]
MVKLNRNYGIKFLSGLLLVSSLVFCVVLSQSAEAALGGQEIDAEKPQQRIQYQVPRRWADRNELAATIANNYGVPYGAVIKYCNENGCLEDACRIAYMAKLTDSSFDSVAGLKNCDNTWTDVSEALGISEDLVRAYRQNALIDRINLRYGIDRASVAALIEQRYKIMDIVKASRLAHETGMDVMTVMSHKALNNTWAEVAMQLTGSELEGL